MADFNLDEMIAQREEALKKEDGKTIAFEFDGEKYDKSAGDCFTFDMKGATYHVRDPRWLLDDESEQLATVSGGIDIACWYLGEAQFDKYIAAGGQTWMIMRLMEQFQESITDEKQGNPTQRNRSSRRAAAQKSPKRR